MVEQKWDAAAYARNARFVSDLGIAALDLLAVKPGETIIDLGCGDGALTEKILDAGATVIGIDADQAMVDAAVDRGIDARLGDATDFELPEMVDAVFSNAVLHWVPKADDAIRQVKAHLKPGGRFVGEFGGHGNIAAVCTALRAVAIQWGLGPDCLPNWFFPTRDQYHDMLEDAGFMVREIAIFPRLTHVPAGIEAWLELMTAKTIAKLPVNERPQFVKEVAALLKPALQAYNGEWHIDYVRIQFEAIIPDDDD
ncbi:MAG TPA: SAM-dependent methyltransferase [Rhodospirillaceae bacterium]|nr:SAM-dependent methyltransferase [Alphaproteobacteria bacterium]OUT41880.1 MAG: hypothetical protein CBB62_06100 [Micavibrio sp. TMED2]HCI46418.1 SAM-dependent methyltransferase [Rhodospirillaceae bacterium]MAS46529.1 SAM-dependent methyltransferase [Alphaproteobacteria bacterium]MAX94623.1 SAM-dependent methyltransferase [Alphaproteobacteria bacterium]|tara:strand:- start:7245 stop:8006 length:762 start_codon:yes stop_codon:yes gene_type:complete